MEENLTLCPSFSCTLRESKPDAYLFLFPRDRPISMGGERRSGADYLLILTRRKKKKKKKKEKGKDFPHLRLSSGPRRKRVRSDGGPIPRRETRKIQGSLRSPKGHWEEKANLQSVTTTANVPRRNVPPSRTLFSSVEGKKKKEKKKGRINPISAIC